MTLGGTKNLKTKGAFALFWVVISLLVLGGATFAWFTFSTSTKVTPMAGAVGNGGVELLISSNESGPFEKTTELYPEGALDNLQPVSTADLVNWYASAGNNTLGISNKFIDVTEKKDEMTMYGTVYLKSQGGSCNVYLDPEAIAFSEDDQLIASCRLALTITTVEETSKKYIFKLDDFGNTTSAESQITMNDTDVVVSSADGTTEPDPAENPEQYFAVVVGDEVTEPGTSILCKLADEEVGRIDYRIYMEGCDENCFNVAQDKGITLQLGFAGVESK